MTVRVTTVLECDECGKDGPEQFGKVAMINWVRMVARNFGWTTNVKQGKKVDICPDCKVKST